ncbi:MAG: Asp-tRNA(Asn)/Glu-tRNA(Gln) amidotransferase subunit GatA [Oscillospiraceae bacterium]|jgi:aspartyl-tRNA(Asn)/glutamyl-tRNA(Gln) amidotransferase subunit A|nr:Asp-tRNA(Asn)/Glu-tRNA(Gln) amidotransferase subunit GatA [Oscillospiraceae bacterium]
MSALIEKTLFELSNGLAAKEFSSVEVTKAYLDAIESKEPDVKAYLTVDAEGALATAKDVDEQRMQGKALSPLAGIPAGIKDNICTRGLRTTCASKMLAEFRPPYDASVIEKLKQSSYVLLGKLNMDEFAMGSTTENSYFQVTKNPRNLSCVPGGSSGGSAAAVAALEAAYTLGSDTGGSIRLPASFCGVVGMKPTYGTVSRYGLVAFASSLDQIGPLTKDVRDNAMVLNAISGHDPRDPTSLNQDVPDYMAGLKKGVKGLKIGLPKEFFGGGIHPEVKHAVLTAASKLEAQGAQLLDVSMPSIEHALAAYYVISSAEASSNLARFDGVRYGYRSKQFDDMDSLYQMSRSEGFGPEVKRRIMLGTFALSSGYYDAYYKKALQVRSLVMKEFSAVLETCDLILSPVAPTVAYRIGEKTQNSVEMYMGDAYTVPVNIAGVPALSLPCGKDSDGMPIGMQLIGRHFSEPLLYQAGYAFEQNGGAK